MLFIKPQWRDFVKRLRKEIAQTALNAVIVVCLFACLFFISWLSISYKGILRILMQKLMLVSPLILHPKVGRGMLGGSKNKVWLIYVCLVYLHMNIK